MEGESHARFFSALYSVPFRFSSSAKTKSVTQARSLFISRSLSPVWLVSGPLVVLGPSLVWGIPAGTDACHSLVSDDRESSSCRSGWINDPWMSSWSLRSGRTGNHRIDCQMNSVWGVTRQAAGSDNTRSVRLHPDEAGSRCLFLTWVLDSSARWNSFEHLYWLRYVIKVGTKATQYASRPEPSWL